MTKESRRFTFELRLNTAILVVLLSIYSAAVNADADDLSKFPHPSCLDFDRRAITVNNFLVGSLNLKCPLTGSKSDVIDYFDFIAYERPHDEFGKRRGILGYLRFVSKDDAALYLLRNNSGNNIVSTVILTGKEITTATSHSLEQGQVHGTGEDCQGVTDIWIEPNNKIHVSVELSVYEALQAVLLPNSGPPSSKQKSKLLKTLLSQQGKAEYHDYQWSCTVTAEYRFDSANLELQLNSLRFDNFNDESSSAFRWFKSLLPESENLEVGILIEEELSAILKKLLGTFKHQYQFTLPEQTNESFSMFLEQLKSAVKHRDIEALLKMTSEDVMLGFGGSGGHQDLFNWLTGENVDEYWHNINKMLKIPGIQMSSEVFCLPYPGCIYNDSVEFSVDAYLTLQADTPLYALPKDNARILRKLNFERVEWQYPYENKTSFRLVETFVGERGYIHEASLRSPLDTRMEVSLTPKGWLIQSILSGD